MEMILFTDYLFCCLHFRTMDRTWPEEDVNKRMKIVNQIIEKCNLIVIHDNKHGSWFLIQFVPPQKKPKKAAILIYIYSPFSGFKATDGLRNVDIDRINKMYAEKFGLNSAMEKSEFRHSLKAKERKNELIFVLAGAICMAMGQDVCAFKNAILDDEHENTDGIWKNINQILDTCELPIGSGEDIWEHQ